MDFEPSIEELTRQRANDERGRPVVESVNQAARVNTLLSNFFQFFTKMSHKSDIHVVATLYGI